MEQSQPVNKIGRDFNFWQFFRFALPTLATQLFLAIFKTIDDGLFVSNFVGADALSAINIVFPLVMLMGGPGMIFAAGGSAVCARKMGEGKPEEAKRCFTTVILLCALSGMVMGLTCLLFQRPLLRALGATELLMEDCIVYSTITFIDFCFTMSCPVFDFFYSAAGKPGMSMVASPTNGAVNIICDVIFIVVMDLGVLGAALSTFLGSLSFCTVGLIFYCNKKHEIHFTTPAKEVGTIVKDVFSVGIASFANTLAMAAASYIANLVMLDLVGEDGVAAYAIFGYLQYIMGAMLFAKSVTVKLIGHSKSIKRLEYGVKVAPNLIANGARTASVPPLPPEVNSSPMLANSLPTLPISCKSSLISLLTSNNVAGEIINPKSVTLKPARNHL